MLRAARVKKELSPEQICQELGLTQSNLKALEDDDHEVFRAEAYIKGYIRRYCSVLDIAEEDVLASYELSRRKAEQSDAEPGEPSSQQVTIAFLGKPLFNKSLLDKLKMSNWTFPLGLCAFAISASVLLASVTSSGHLVAEEIRPAAPKLGADLEITLSQQSWVEVTDARGDILAANLSPAGARLQLSGTPPFQLSLDNGKGANVSYRQQPIHLVVNSSDNTVQMTVGG